MKDPTCFDEAVSGERFELQRRVLEASHCFGQAVAYEIELEPLCDLIVTTLTEIFGAETTTLLFRDEATDEFYVKRSNGPVDEELTGRLKRGQGIVATAMSEQRIVRQRGGDPLAQVLPESLDVEDDHELVAVPFKADKSSWTPPPPKAPLATVPLVAERKVKGVVAMSWATDSDRPRDLDLEMLDVMAARVANAIDNAWLYERLRSWNAELELKVEERTKDLESALEELKQTQVQLVQNEKMASLGQLTSGVAHEINNPLAYSISNIALAEERLRELSLRFDLLRCKHDIAAPVGHAERRRLGMDFVQRLGEVERYKDDVLSFGAEVRELAEGPAVELIGQFLTYVEAREEQALGHGELFDSTSRLLERSHTGLERVKGIVLNLRSFSRLDEAHFLTADIDEGIESTLSIVSNLAKERQVNLTHDAGLDASYSCFSAKLNQVVLNLVTNAIQATERGGSVTVETRETDEGPRVQVRDTGCGISEEHLTKVFDPFFTTKPVGEGTGLGLSISYKIIEEHKGTLLVDSAEGEGTTFTIQLPPRGQ